MSKGDTRRPSSVSKGEYDANYEAAFGKKELKQWEDAPRVDEGDRGPNGEVSSDEHGGRGIHGPTGSVEVEGEATEEGEPN